MPDSQEPKIEVGQRWWFNTSSDDGGVTYATVVEVVNLEPSFSVVSTNDPYFIKEKEDGRPLRPTNVNFEAMNLVVGAPLDIDPDTLESVADHMVKEIGWALLPELCNDPHELRKSIKDALRTCGTENA